MSSSSNFAAAAVIKASALMRSFGIDFDMEPLKGGSHDNPD